MSVYVTADPEGNFKYIEDFCKKFNTMLNLPVIYREQPGYVFYI